MTDSLALQRCPMPGDAVRIVNHGFSISKIGSIGIIQGIVGRYPEDHLAGICFAAYSLFRGKSSAYSTRPEYVSCSGGPATIATDLRTLTPTDESKTLTAWRWKSLPCANGGEQYQVTVPLWDWDPKAE